MKFKRLFTGLLISLLLCTTVIASSLIINNNSVLSLDGNGYASGTGTDIFNTAVSVIKIRFKPDFISSTGLSHTFCDSTSGARYFLRKNSTGAIDFFTSSASLRLTSDYATWSPHWNEFDWNEIIVVTTEAGGATSYMKLNGVVIDDSGFAAIRHNPTVFYVGSNYGGSTRFEGLIDYLRVYSDDAMTTLTANYEFDGDYTSGVSATNNLSAVGSGNTFVIALPGIFNTEKQMATDGNMEMSGVTDWTVGGSATITKETTNPKEGKQSLKVAYNAASNPYALQDVGFVSGTTYRIGMWAHGDGSKAPSFYVSNTGSDAHYDFTNSTDWQYGELIWTADGGGAAPTSIRLFCLAISAGDCQFDNVFITEYKTPVNQFSLYKGLTAWLPLKAEWMQSVTVVSDRTPYGHHGTVSGATVGASSTDFNGISDRIDLASGMSPIWNTTGYSIGLKFINKDITQLLGQMFSTTHSSGNAILMIGTDNTENTKVTVFGFDDAGATLVDKTTTFEFLQDTEYCIVWTDLNGTGKFYIDGVEDVTNFNYTPAALTFDVQVLGALNIKGVYSQHFKGEEWDFKRWNRVLEQSDITQFCNNI